MKRTDPWKLKHGASSEQIALLLDIERAKMIGTIGTIITFGLVIYVIGGVGYGLAKWEERQKPEFDIEFIPSDPRFVRIEQDRVHYFVGLRNVSSRTIEYPSVRTIDDEFSRVALTPVDPFGWGQPVGCINIFLGGAIDPDSREFIKLFDWPNDAVLKPDAVMGKPHHFVLETRGRNARALTFEFEYDPSRFPRVIKCAKRRARWFGG